MLAGVGGIDLVLFVVAADESVKPQTREHFDICRLLEIPRGIVALTKADLADDDLLDLVRLEVEELVAGSFLEGAPMVAVSSITGAGLEELREELARAAAAVRGAQRRGPFPAAHRSRLFRERLRHGGHRNADLRRGGREQEVELYPAGRRLRVRGVQVHGAATERAVAGQRTAVNLADIEPAELARGDVLSEPGRFRAVKQVDCRLELLPSAKPLKHRAPVHFHSGTAEIEAEVRLLGGATLLRPGGTAYARLLLREPALLLPGDRFIIRMFSPVVTIGGGARGGCWASARRRGARMSPPGWTCWPPAMPRGPRGAAGARSRLMALGIAELVARMGMTAPEIAGAAGAGQSGFAPAAPAVVRGSGLVRRRGRTAGESRARVSPAGIRCLRVSRGRICATPSCAGCPAFLLDALLAGAAGIVAEGELVRARGHRLVLQEDEEHARASIERAFEAAGLAAPAWKDVLAQSGVEPARARTLLEMLLREKRLVRVNEDLVFHRSAIDELRRMLAARRTQRFGVPEFKEWTGVSRKYAIPLLEYLDRERITRREAHERVVL